jgi:hypothetical protein
VQFRNKLVDAHPRASFEDVQRRVRWRYQWLAINDFIPGICGADVVKITAAALRPERAGLEEQADAELNFCRWVNDPFMPIEFSAAAHRFGHSMVRPVSRLNTRLKGSDDPAQAVRKRRFARTESSGRSFAVWTLRARVIANAPKWVASPPVPGVAYATFLRADCGRKFNLTRREVFLSLSSRAETSSRPDVAVPC